MGRQANVNIFGLVLCLVFAGCESDARTGSVGAASSCMRCHNGSQENDYSGPGIEDPHPFGVAANLACTTCHGGDPNGGDKASSHVPPPPEIGDRANWVDDRKAYFNRLTLTGIDKFPDYVVDGVTYTALDFLQFVNPGDLRVAQQGRACGQCHEPHVDTVSASLLATEAGILSGASYAIGADNAVPASDGLYEDTAADLGFRAVSDPDFVFDANDVGPVSELVEFPVYSVFGVEEPNSIYRNNAYLAAELADDRNADNSVVTDSPLSHLFHEQVAFTCGDCHLGSAGANNRYGDFRSSGCTACHMPYSLDGRSRSNDPNVDKAEPVDPDDIDEPELAHVRSHRIRSVHKTAANGVQIEGIDDHTCAGCHQGSNRTVMQFWGIRLDQNQDLRRGVQYPSMPASFRNTNGDTRLFDPAVGNNTFNGRNRNQYILFEDYDGDDRDDTPPDIHYELGLGCIDCHGSVDLHGGNVADADRDQIHSRMEQGVKITCESCHGSGTAYAATTSGLAFDGQTRQLATDTAGNVLDHVVLEPDGNYYLYSRLTGVKHFVPQTRDVIVDSGKTNPFTSEEVYNAKASYAMGRKDGNANTGIGPQQTGGALNGFSHMDNMSCASCHSSWTNTCMGCHLEGEYSTNPNNFSNITGDRIVFRERNADFVYQSPLFFQLGIGPRNKVEQVSPNTVAFFTYRDRQGNFSNTFAFSDRNGGGNNPASAHPAMSHNAMMAHSIRGRVDDANEGPRYCVACHLTDAGIAAYGAANYDSFVTAMATGNFAALDFDELEVHFGQNTGNTLNSPLFVHMVAGLGSGVFLFDEDGCPVNPLDQDDERKGCDDGAPADHFNLANVRFNMDRIVESDGSSNASNNHALLAPGVGPFQRDGAANQNLSGPLGSTLIQRLTDRTTGIVLDSWIDPDGVKQGDASSFVPD
ncbi:MAG: hypothetical protein KDB80_05635 [Planctomycetes bacterium]|nr:hypothetical protein [Planctomycetota bacterium]